MPFLINAAQLDKFRKNQKNILLFDASVHTNERDARQEFLDKHIIGSHFFDLQAFNDPDPTAPHSNMILDDEARMAALLGKMGIRNDYKIVFYDNSSLHTSARALWLLKFVGHNPNLLYILDGGLAAWERNKGKTEVGQPVVVPRSYSVTLQSQWMRTLKQMKDNMITPTEQIIDVRHAVRFAGGPEPREGVRSGHIPDSFSTPLSIFFTNNGLFLSVDKMRKKIRDLGVNLNCPVITSCGSGMTAPTLNFILDLISTAPNALYNGSWTEWGRDALYAGEATLDERPISNCVDPPLDEQVITC